MIRRRFTLSSLTFILCAVAICTSALTRASAQSSDDDASDKPSRLTVTSDFNHDGIPDMAEATSPAENDSGPNLLTISLGQPDGTFRQVSTLTLGSRPRDIVAGDFNQDGIPDLIVGDDNGALTLFLGDGTGNLRPGTEIAHLQSVVSIAVADFNHDGILDLAVSDSRGSSVIVFLGSGKGSFRAVSSLTLRTTGAAPHVSAADFNGDGVPDLAIVYAEGDESTFDVMLGNGDGSFTYAPHLSLVRDPNSRCPS